MNLELGRGRSGWSINLRIVLLYIFIKPGGFNWFTKAVSLDRKEDLVSLSGREEEEQPASLEKSKGVVSWNHSKFAKENSVTGLNSV